MWLWPFAIWCLLNLSSHSGVDMIFSIVDVGLSVIFFDINIAHTAREPTCVSTFCKWQSIDHAVFANSILSTLNYMSSASLRDKFSHPI